MLMMLNFVLRLSLVILKDAAMMVLDYPVSIDFFDDLLINVNIVVFLLFFL
jgi:hypothetical protein